MKVFNADGSGKALVVASSVTVAEFLPVLADNMKVENPGSYKLWELDDLTGGTIVPLFFFFVVEIRFQPSFFQRATNWDQTIMCG